MTLEELRERTCRANQAISRAGLAILTFGNASAVDRAAGVFAIKPSGVPSDALSPDDIVVVALDDGRIVEGRHRRPSSDTPTHRVLYQAFGGVGGIVHTHSSEATAWAQAGRSIPCLGTTHADHFRGAIPVTRALSTEDVEGDYEANTGKVIAELFRDEHLDPADMPAVLVASHGPFAWGPYVEGAVANAIALEEVARVALRTLLIAPETVPIAGHLRERHHTRKHGPESYYGQPGKEPAPRR